RPGHQRGDHLSPAQPAAPRRAGHHHLARVAQRAAPALLPAHQRGGAGPGPVHHRVGPFHRRGRPPAATRRQPMTTEVDALVLRYLQDLEGELRDLPANRRQELLNEVGEHIAAARAALDPETEAGVRTVLERLGDPADIAAEARERVGVQRPPVRPATPWLEVIAIVLLVIPFAGWVVGVVLVWLSRLWTTRDKLIGTLGGMSWVLAGLGTVMTSAGGSRAVGSAPLGPSETSLMAVVLVVTPFVLPVVA